VGSKPRSPHVSTLPVDFSASVPSSPQATGAPKERTTAVAGMCHEVEAGRFQLGPVGLVRVPQGATSRKSISSCGNRVYKHMEV